MNNDKNSAEQDRYDQYLLNQEQAWNARCTRCGSCCGADEDPCENLQLLSPGLYACQVYERRFGAWRTRSGKSFVCVPIRDKIAQGQSWPGDENCGYTKGDTLSKESIDQNQKTKDAMLGHMTFPRLKFTCIKNDNNFCYHHYKVGDEFILKDFTHAPENFCLAITHAAFPCMHALTFGGRFPFMENTASINVTCPDGGKMAFKLELLDENGNVVVEPQKEKSKGPSPKKMLIEVEHSDGTCHYCYREGRKWEVEGLKTPEGFCGAAYHLLFPVLFEMNFGASFSFEKDPNCKTGITCPDGGKVKFKVTRIEN